MRRYDALLMDADETLFDFHRSEAEALRLTLEECGVPCSPEVERLYSRINDGLWKEFEQGKVTKPFLQKARFVRLFEQLGAAADGELASERYPMHRPRRPICCPMRSSSAPRWFGWAVPCT